MVLLPLWECLNNHPWSGSYLPVYDFSITWYGGPGTSFCGILLLCRHFGKYVFIHIHEPFQNGLNIPLFLFRHGYAYSRQLIDMHSRIIVSHGTTGTVSNLHEMMVRFIYRDQLLDCQLEEQPSSSLCKHESFQNLKKRQGRSIRHSNIALTDLLPVYGMCTITYLVPGGTLRRAPIIVLQKVEICSEI